MYHLKIKKITYKKNKNAIFFWMKTNLFTKIIKLGKSRHGLCFSVCNITAGAELDVSVIHEMWFGESCGKTRRKCKKLSVWGEGVGLIYNRHLRSLAVLQSNAKL